MLTTVIPDVEILNLEILGVGSLRAQGRYSEVESCVIVSL